MLPPQRSCCLALAVCLVLVWLVVSYYVLTTTPATPRQAASNTGTTAAAAATTVLPASCPAECEPEVLVARRFGVTDLQHYRRSRCCKRHAVLKEMLLALFEFLDSEGIPWMLDGGTLLGNIRHRGMLVPWDDDADVAVLLGIGPTPLRRDDYRQRLMRFNSFRPAASTANNRFEMRACHFDFVENACDTAFRIHLRGNGRHRMSKLWIEDGSPTLDVQPMELRSGSSSIQAAAAAADATVPTDDIDRSCYESASCFKYLNRYWRGIEYASTSVLPLALCRHRFYGSTTRPVYCPRGSNDVLQFLYGDFTLIRSAKDSWGVHGVHGESKRTTGRKRRTGTGSGIPLGRRHRPRAGGLEDSLRLHRHRRRQGVATNREPAAKPSARTYSPRVQAVLRAQYLARLNSQKRQQQMPGSGDGLGLAGLLEVNEALVRAVAAAIKLGADRRTWKRLEHALSRLEESRDPKLRVRESCAALFRKAAEARKKNRARGAAAATNAGGAADTADADEQRHLRRQRSAAAPSWWLSDILDNDLESAIQRLDVESSMVVRAVAALVDRDGGVVGERDLLPYRRQY